MHGPAAGKGKWSRAGVPHKGWTCSNVEDLGSPDETCQMCETAEIRFVHYMTHPGYPETLACGAICAGHMEQDLVGAEARDRKMRSAASRRKRFPERSGWLHNANGNPQIKISGIRVTMFQKGKFWRGVVAAPGRDSIFTRDRFTDLDDAKRAAFDTLDFLIEQQKAKPRRPYNPADYF